MTKVQRTTQLIVLSVLVALASAATTQPQTVSASSKREEGVRLYRQRDFSAAVKVLTAATKQDKTDVEAWYYLGLALRRSGNLKNARKSFETVLKLQPTHSDSRVALADTFISLGKVEEADDEANRAVLHSPTNAEAHFLLGKIDLLRGMCAHATIHAEKALEIDTQFAPAYLLKSLVAICGVGQGRNQNVAKGISGEKSNDQIEQARLDDSRRKALAAPFVEAADYLQKFIDLSPADEDISVWKNQLETLKVYSETAETPQHRSVYLGSEVETKVRILQKPEPAYTERARNTGLIGTVILRAVFAADGSIKHILVLRSLPLGLTQQAIEAAKKIRFEPAMVGGKKVSTILQVEYNFNLY